MGFGKKVPLSGDKPIFPGHENPATPYGAAPVRTSGPRAGGPPVPLRSRTLRQPARRRGERRPHPQLAIHPLQARGRGARRPDHLAGTDARNPLRVDRRSDDAPPRKRRPGLLRVGQRQAGDGLRRRVHPHGVRPDPLYPAGRKPVPDRAAPLPGRGVAAGAAPAGRTALGELSFQPAAAFDRRLPHCAGPRLAEEVRSAETRNHRPQRLQLRGAGQRGLRHLLARGQAARLLGPAGHHRGPLAGHARFSPSSTTPTGTNGATAGPRSTG